MKLSEVRAKIKRNSDNISNFFKTGKFSEDAFSDEELGINTNDYINEDGTYKDYTGNKYHNDRYYEIFKIFYNIMKPTKEDFYTLRYYYESDRDYSFVKSPALRYLLFGGEIPDTGDNDKYYYLLDIEIRKIMQVLIPKVFNEKKKEVNQSVCAKIKKIKESGYIFTEYENRKTFIPLLLYNSERKVNITFK